MQHLRTPLSDEDEREFLTQWTTWRDGHMVVTDQIGEEGMDRLWDDLHEFGRLTLVFWVIFSCPILGAFFLFT